MKNTSKILSVSALALALMPISALPDESDAESTPGQEQQLTREQRRAAWENLTDEEKQAKREEMRAQREEMRAQREQRRAEWESLTPEEREAKRSEMRKRWESMTPEQREAVKERRSQRGRRPQGN